MRRVHEAEHNKNFGCSFSSIWVAFPHAQSYWSLRAMWRAVVGLWCYCPADPRATRMHVGTCTLALSDTLVNTRFRTVLPAALLMGIFALVFVNPNHLEFSRKSKFTASPPNPPHSHTHAHTHTHTGVNKYKPSRKMNDGMVRSKDPTSEEGLSCVKSRQWFSSTLIPLSAHTLGACLSFSSRIHSAGSTGFTLCISEMWFWWSLMKLWINPSILE